MLLIWGKGKHIYVIYFQMYNHKIFLDLQCLCFYLLMCLIFFACQIKISNSNNYTYY